MKRCRIFAAFLLSLGVLCSFAVHIPSSRAAGVVFGAPAFGAAWAQTDEAVASGAARRGFVWGAMPTTNALMEPYREAPGGQRLVQYFDKARMELGADGSVTTGLLVRELITGRIQTGDTTADTRATGSMIPCAGDATNTFPTYAQLRDRLDRPQTDATGRFVTETLTPTAGDTLAATPDGKTDAAADPNAALVQFVPETGQTIPRAFWSFFASPANGDAPLFDWRRVVGLPLAPAFWATVIVGGVPKQVLIQPFERRVLTYTPTNAAGFTVEMGNVGQHYFRYRYLGADATLQPAQPTVATTKTLKPTAAPTITNANGVHIAHIAAKAANLADETATIRNDGLTTTDLTRWTLSDSGRNVFIFPALTLPPGGIVVVHSGRGTTPGTDLYWNKNVGVWRDTGDTATLRDAAGTVVSTYTYP